MKNILVALVFACTATLELSAQSVEQLVEIHGQDGSILAGTLLLPSVEQNSALPIALLVAGSGRTDRNGNNRLTLNNSLKMLAEGLALEGVASLRYDKRGVGGSLSHHLNRPAITISTYIEDAKRWIEYIKTDSRFAQLTIIGHSQGAKLALSVLVQGSSAEQVILISGAGQPLDMMLKRQLKGQPKQIKELSYAIIDTLKKGKTYDNVPVFLNSLFRSTAQPRLIAEFAIKPTELAAKIDIPMLIIQGTTDIQVTTQDAIALSEANQKAQLVIIENMNHLLKECLTTDKEQQKAYYSNPNIELHPHLIPAVANFILNPQRTQDAQN